MIKVACQLFVACLYILSFRPVSFAQQAEAPIYRDGDWWRVKVQVKRPTGVAVGGPQLGGFPEYLVRIDSGTHRVFGVHGEQRKEIEAPNIFSLVLGKPDWRGELLKFPLQVGLKWSAWFTLQLPGLRGRLSNANYEVQAWERVKTLKGEFDAFKILMEVPGLTTPQRGGPSARAASYYYAPKVKAIVYLEERSPPNSPEAETTSALVDFNVGQQ
jgi:hypothetical protein